MFQMALSSTPGNNLCSHPVDIASHWQRYRQPSVKIAQWWLAPAPFCVYSTMVACSSPIMPLFWQWYPIPDPLAPLGISIILRDYLSNRTRTACSSPIWRLFNNGGLLQPHYALILAMVSHSGSISPLRHFDNPTGLSFKSHNDGSLQPDLAFIQQRWLAPAPLCPYSGSGIPFRIH
ncbi:hypothetical protein IV203_016555 [Nitzschia inconspicua]|uniref:Uncharacterized protein n=1 Tax=Nitzschia inconspicua TaxID=303405 RepID=A0A9K3KRG3_9STRA|nr:hypothetical protein IV203_016555 [Nitzschia inconspicua]